MSYKETLVGFDIDLFTNTYVEIIENMFEYFKLHRCLLGFDNLFIGTIVKGGNNEIKITHL